MNIKDKLNKILKDNNLNGAKFASILGLNKSGVYKALRGETNKLHPDTIELILNKFPNYSKEWLLSDEEDNNIIKSKNGVIEVQKIVETIYAFEDKFMKNKDFENLLEKYYIKKLNEFLIKNNLKAEIRD